MEYVEQWWKIFSRYCPFELYRMHDSVLEYVSVGKNNENNKRDKREASAEDDDDSSSEEGEEDGESLESEGMTEVKF